LKVIVHDLLKHPKAWPFLQPVDPVALNIPDYFEIIEHPMDLGTIHTNIENGVYDSNPIRCLDDIDLVWRNCYLYNPPKSDVSKMASILQGRFVKAVTESTLFSREDKLRIKKKPRYKCFRLGSARRGVKRSLQHRPPTPSTPMAPVRAPAPDTLRAAHSASGSAVGVVECFLRRLQLNTRSVIGQCVTLDDALRTQLETLCNELQPSVEYFTLTSDSRASLGSSLSECLQMDRAMAQLREQFGARLEVLSDTLYKLKAALSAVTTPNAVGAVHDTVRRTLRQIGTVLTWCATPVYTRALLCVERLRLEFEMQDIVPELRLPGEFMLLGKAGSGTFSDVFYAVMPTNARYPLVAVKRLKLTATVHVEILTDKQDVFPMNAWQIITMMKVREEAMLRLLGDNKHIVGLAVDDLRTPFDMIVLQATTCTLKDLLEKRKGRVPRWFLAAVGMGLFQGLVAVHAYSLIHNDIKPSNIHFLMTVAELESIMDVSLAFFAFLRSLLSFLLVLLSTSLCVTLTSLRVCVFAVVERDATGGCAGCEDWGFWECCVCALHSTKLHTVPRNLPGAGAGARWRRTAAADGRSGCVRGGRSDAAGGVA
jgi:hypothetical protein